MAKSYTSVFEVMIDYGLFMAVDQNADLTAGFIIPLARNRWPWLANNWAKIYPRFKAATNGSQTLLDSLDSLDRAVQSYHLGNVANYLESPDNYKKAFPFLQSISINDLRLTPEEATIKDKEIDRVRRFEVDDFKAMYHFIRKDSALFAGSIGLGDATTNKLLNIRAAKKLRSATIADVTRMADIEQLKNAISATIYNLQRVTKRPPNLIDAANKNIDASSPVQFDNTYLSYFTQPFEVSLEHMAKKYLGSVDKFFELVSVNNLKPPYIDESGEKFELLAPAAVNNLVISSARKEDTPVGSKIRLGSYSQKEESRVIERVIFNENNTMILFLSGSQDLNRFTPSEKAYVRIYKPATTRPGEFLFIPVPFSTGDGIARKTPMADYLRRLSTTLRNFGVDIYRDQKTGDFVFDPNGNFKVAAGYDNVRQTVLSALKRKQGELPFHPGYGVNVEIGNRFFGTTDEAVVFSELLRTTILRDPRFESVLISQISTTGRSISLKLLVKIAGTSEFVPLAFIS